MRAKIESTDRIVDMRGGYQARVWEGVTEGGVAFVAYISVVQVKSTDNNYEFELELQEHKRPCEFTTRSKLLRELAAEIARLRAERDGLRKALMPFANNAARCEGKRDDGLFEVRIGHLHEARAALAQIEEGER